MRITQNMMTSQFLYNLTNSNTTVMSLENEMSTGKTLNLPSDNPLGVSQDMATRAQISQTNVYTSTISEGLSWMQTTNSIMEEISQSLTSIQSGLLQGLNTPNQSASSKEALASSVEEYAQQIFNLLNTQQGSEYLFGGTQTQSPPVTTSATSTMNTVGFTLSSAIPSGTIPYQVANGVQIDINISAFSIIGATLTGGTSSTATLQNTLQQMGNDIATGNTTNMNQDLQNLQAAMASVTNLTTDLGARTQRMTAIQTQTTQYSSILTNQKGVIEDANMAQVITQFNTDQVAFQAALQMGSKVLQPTLVSYLPS